MAMARKCSPRRSPSTNWFAAARALADSKVTGALGSSFLLGLLLLGMGGEALKGHLDLLLLTSIEAGAAHGYAIADKLRRASDGTFDLPDGTIYPALHRLRDAGLVTSEWSDDERRRRRVYALTPKGRKALTEQRASWARFERGVRSVLALTSAQ